MLWLESGPLQYLQARSDASSGPMTSIQRATLLWRLQRAKTRSPEVHLVSNTTKLTDPKVSDFVKPFNRDGFTFIRAATKNLMYSDSYADVTPRLSWTQKQARSRSPSPVHLTSPKVFSHYVLNLPASAITFLPAFIGLHEGCADIFQSHTPRRLPLVHVYCFSTKSNDNKEEEEKICKEISEQIQFKIRPGNLDVEGEAEIWDVRDVAPMKRMFCASFRLPEEVAFRKRPDRTKP